MNDELLLLISFVFYTYLLVAAIRFLHLNFMFLWNTEVNNQYDLTLPIKHLLLAVAYDNFIDLTQWSLRGRIETVNTRARSYGNSEDR